MGMGGMDMEGLAMVLHCCWVLAYSPLHSCQVVFGDSASCCDLVQQTGQASPLQSFWGPNFNLFLGEALFLLLFSSFGLILGDSSGSDALFLADASLVTICRMCGLYTLWCVDSFYTVVSVRVR